MSTAPRLEHYLSRSGVAYDLMRHEPTATSMRTAKVCDVPADMIAKAVVLKDKAGYMLAVLPASRHLSLRAVSEMLDEEVELAREAEIERLFPDCARGAVPPLGAAYGMPMIVDEMLADLSDIYFEAGDHETIVHMSGRDFRQLAGRARHGRICLQQ
ncbi:MULTISPECIES: aminoacyl-tRNA deacylase [Chelatococcus]|uniref:Ala-tRNA(Pro) deacylase n=1 Tax=Chelatococcus caeni TaxID=1348468 RepID=A0A840CBI4_9HYPH|nr:MULTISPECIES: YbaK/EbsC family protein [Chelatococcus]ALA16634.1 YbaK/prolyl-tRNA synthetase associated protein [Chelatococcus sp. CO-6]MBB4019637.1 Ala-tRNA(Pro) deacylase [Chelatococcus caeni]